MTVVQSRRLPALRAPIAVLAFGGWGDAAEASTMAISTLSAQLNSRPFATIDPDEFYDFTQVRPRVYLTSEMSREVEWPAATFNARRRSKESHDIITFQAFEPQLRWRLYVEGILDFLQRLRVSTLVSVGSLLADVPHTRSVRITGFATDPELQRRLHSSGISLSQYEGPTGILGVLHQGAKDREIPSLSLWGAAPHYISTAANPRVALALLDSMASLFDWSLDLSSLRQEAKEFDIEVDGIIQSNPEASAYVTQLEGALEEEDGPTSRPLPTSDALLKDLEAFLRGEGEKPPEQGPSG